MPGRFDGAADPDDGEIVPASILLQIGQLENLVVLLAAGSLRVHRGTIDFVLARGHADAVPAGDERAFAEGESGSHCGDGLIFAQRCAPESDDGKHVAREQLTWEND